ncbi:hypothetical protein C8Q80DRAFT_1264175 [Daedaleopsis nitida]|nr:hypothetical protein C8Q80DRAFT_1264175 [Daedaleopsis nitida]
MYRQQGFVSVWPLDNAAVSLTVLVVLMISVMTYYAISTIIYLCHSLHSLRAVRSKWRTPPNTSLRQTRSSSPEEGKGVSAELAKASIVSPPPHEDHSSVKASFDSTVNTTTLNQDCDTYAVEADYSACNPTTADGVNQPDEASPAIAGVVASASAVSTIRASDIEPELLLSIVDNMCLPQEHPDEATTEVPPTPREFQEDAFQLSSNEDGPRVTEPAVVLPLEVAATSVGSQIIEADTDNDPHSTTSANWQEYLHLPESAEDVRKDDEERGGNSTAPEDHEEHARSDVDDIVEYIMHSALLVDDFAALDATANPATEVAREDGEDDGDGDNDDDTGWTAVEHPEARTPRASTPLGGLVDSAEPLRNGTDELAASGVLLGQSEYLPHQLVSAPDSHPANDRAPSDSSLLPEIPAEELESAIAEGPVPLPPAAHSASSGSPATPSRHVPAQLDLTKQSEPGPCPPQSPSPRTPASPGSIRARVHTRDRPDWAVAPSTQASVSPRSWLRPRENRDDAVMSEEKKARRHSSEHPDWAVAAACDEDFAPVDSEEREVDLHTQLAHSMGAVLIGSLIALFLSGAVWMQVFLYWQLYPKDNIRIKAMVMFAWVLDTLHSIMTMVANWQYLIVDYGRWDTIDHITWSIAVSVALTASITFFVHCFFIHRIYSLSRRNYFIAAPLVLLALVRLVAASISTSEMINLKSYAGFVQGYDFVFTIGLSTAASLDVFITIGLCYYLRRGRTGLGSMDRIVDSITLYTVENGMLTCLTTSVSLICWLTMPTNLIFLGLHFAISKLYANSFLATLNSRKSLMNKSQASSGDYPLPVRFPSSFRSRGGNGAATAWSHRSQVETQLQVTVEKTVHHAVDVDPEPSSDGGSSSRMHRDTTIDLSKTPPAVYLPSE